MNSVTLSQTVIESNGYRFTLEEINSGLQHIDFTVPVQSNDDPLVKLYKQYFNPASFSVYRSFFLPGDWGGFTQADFDSWQSHIHNNQMILDKTMLLRDHFGNAYAICQYRLSTREYEIPGTAIFKKINREWKHISFMNDEQASDLKKIGLLEDDYLKQLQVDGSSIQMREAASVESKKAIEKFDRDQLFISVRGYLSDLGVSTADLEIAEYFFTRKAEVEMVKYIAEAYHLDPYDMMKELNTLLGFTLYKYVQTAKTN